MDEQGRLANAGGHQQFVRSLEAHLGEIPAKHLIGAGIKTGGRLRMLGEAFAHTDFLSSLTGEEKCE